MSGSTPACCDARAMVEVLLGRRPVNKLRDFVLHVFDLNRQVLHVNEVDDVYNLWMPLNLYDYSQNLASSWYEECIEKLGRNKKSVIKVLKQYIKTCQESFSPIFNNLNETLNVLRGFAGKICLERKSIEAVHTELSRVLCALVCHEKYGHDFRSKLKEMKADIKASDSDVVSEEMCCKIVNTLASVYAPPLEKLSEIMKDVECYESFLRKISKRARKILQDEGKKTPDIKKKLKQKGIMHKNIETNKCRGKKKKKER
ncbi:hypothetical protein OTU49_002555 [Cherax quadricarinatus]